MRGKAHSWWGVLQDLAHGIELELLRQLRQTSDVPVLIHSRRSDEIERIIGIEIGADDFMPKPCNMRELLARVRGLLRRSQRSPQPGRADLRRLHFGEWTLDTASRELIHASQATTGPQIRGGPMGIRLRIKVMMPSTRARAPEARSSSARKSTRRSISSWTSKASATSSARRI